MLRHFVDLLNISDADACSLIERALRLKREDGRGPRHPVLPGRTLGLIFEKPSLRTRVSFEAAIARLGGNAIFLRGEEVGLGIRESVADCARILGLYVDALAIRTFSQATIEELARSSEIPVINALSDASHPCQAMADLMTIAELKGTARGLKIVFVGEGNNVARSLACASSLLEAEFLLSAPPGYEFPETFRSQYQARFPGRALRVDPDPYSAVAGADVVYTDVWASMGQEHEAEHRRQVFEPYQVNDDLLSRASSDVIFLHCLPARRGEEVTSSVLDGPHSQAILQAGNRLHFQMALLIWLLTD
jgi:ornithine carbamoyltransferase